MSTRTSPHRPPNRRGQGGQLRAEILIAASAILEETGQEDALTLRAIARRAGITAPAIYAHFADRGEILYAVVSDTFEELAEALRRADRPRARPVNRLRALARAYLDFAAERPQHYRVLFQRHRTDPVDPSTVAPDVQSIVGADAFRVLADAVQGCIDAGRSGASSADEATTRIWIGLHGHAALQASLPWFPWPDRDELADQLLTRLGDLTAER